MDALDHLPQTPDRHPSNGIDLEACLKDLVGSRGDGEDGLEEVDISEEGDEVVVGA